MNMSIEIHAPALGCQEISIINKRTTTGSSNTNDDANIGPSTTIATTTTSSSSSSTTNRISFVTIPGTTGVTTTPTTTTTITNHRVNNDDTYKLLSKQPQSEDDNDDLITTTTYSYVIYIYQSRVLWLGLIPLLFQNNESVSHLSLQLQAIRYILRYHIDVPYYENHYDDNDHDDPWMLNNSMSNNIRSKRFTNITSSLTISSSHFIRSFRWKEHHRHNQKRQQRGMKIILSFVPPQITYIEDTFMRLLIQYEHTHIRAQSISGYISTIGGGYFLCHHFTTAIQLAYYQQYLAILLNDDILYYTCYIHMAYSYIYNGQFHIAQSILRHVLNAIQSKVISQSNQNTTTTNNNNKNKYEIVQNMCYSAQLFGKRMRRYTKRCCSSKTQKVSTSTTTTIISTTKVIPPITAVVGMNEEKGEKESHHQQQQRSNQQTTHVVLMKKTIDNYQRIRIVPDQSKPYDLNMAFSSSC